MPLKLQSPLKLALPPPATFSLVAPPAIAPIPKLLQYTAPPPLLYSIIIVIDYHLKYYKH